MNDQLGQMAGVKIRRTVIKNKPYVEIAIADTLLRFELDAAMELCGGIYEACVGEKFSRLQARAMLGTANKQKN